MEVWNQFISSPVNFEGVLLLISISAGVFGAVLGLGGGIIVVPALTLLFGVNIHYAIGASIVSVIATSSGAAATYVREHITNIRVAMLLEVATTIGALVGATLSTRINSHSLFLIFALILLWSAWLMTRRRAVSEVPQDDYWARKLKLNSSYPDAVLGEEVFYRVARVPLGLLLMLGAGVISGLLGVGSGVLKVPAMDRAMGLPIKVSSATSNFMIGVTAAASAGAYFMRGDIVPFIAAPVAIGVLIGSGIGTRLMVRLPSAIIRKAFFLVLVVVAVEMMLKAFGIEIGK